MGMEEQRKCWRTPPLSSLAGLCLACIRVVAVARRFCGGWRKQRLLSGWTLEGCGGPHMQGNRLSPGCSCPRLLGEESSGFLHTGLQGAWEPPSPFCNGAERSFLGTHQPVPSPTLLCTEQTKSLLDLKKS